MIHEAKPTTSSEERERLLDQAVLSWLEETQAAGRPPERQAFLNRFPHLLPELADFLDGDALLGPALPWQNLPIENASPQLSSFGRYQVLALIDVGGMGEVFRVRDRELNRELALKVLAAGLAQESVFVERFIEEAQIASQLQHPGIPPVHDIGKTPDGRPFFTMKLVRGRNLTTLLAERPNLPHDQPAFLAIFLQLCQTLAHAHSKKVLHRDLKPANIMVGAFGEVQVMDWGLGKVLTSGHARAEQLSLGGKQISTVETVRSRNPGSATQAGSKVGTYAYMPPEQATGRQDQLGAPSDVFGLGAILCEILTGRPPYEGTTIEEVKLRAITADLGAALARLDKCGAAAELVEIAKDCLADDPAKRPPHAGALTERITAYLDSVQERLRQAELAAAKAETRAQEGKKRRRIQAALVGALALMLATWIGVYQWRLNRRFNVTQALTSSLIRVEDLRRQAEALAAEDPNQAKFSLAAWKQAALAAEEAESLARTGDVESSLHDRAVHARLECDRGTQDAEKRLEQRTTEAKFVAALAEAEMLAGVRFIGVQVDMSSALRAFARTFSEFGIVPGQLQGGQFVQILNQMPAAYRKQVLDSAHRWALIGSADSEALLNLADEADADPWRTQLRRAIRLKDNALLEGLMTSLSDSARSSTDHLFLGLALRNANALPKAIETLRQAQRRYPGDFWVNFDLGVSLRQLKNTPQEDICACFQSAWAIRPESPVACLNLSLALASMGRLNDARLCLKEALRFQPDSVLTHFLSGLYHFLRTDFKAAEGSLRTALSQFPDYVEVKALLAVCLAFQLRLSEAEQLVQECERLSPNNGILAYAKLVTSIWKGHQGETAKAARAIALQSSQERWGPILEPLCDLLEGNPRLGEEHAQQAIGILADNGSRGVCYLCLGLAQNLQGKGAQAVEACRQAANLLPDQPLVVEALATALLREGKLSEGRSVLARASKLGGQGVALFGYGPKIFIWDILVGCQNKLDEFENGTLDKNSFSESLKRFYYVEAALLSRRSELAYREYKFLLGDAGIWSNLPSLAWGTNLFGNDFLGTRSMAVWAAILAGTRQGNGPFRMDDEDRAIAREDALRWLRQDLRDIKAQSHGTRHVMSTRLRLNFWKLHPDFAPVRDEEHLTKLPPKEQEDWRKLWRDVDALLAR
jgi:tetratricopeptide (TPR) repeat protein